MKIVYFIDETVCSFLIFGSGLEAIIATNCISIFAIRTKKKTNEMYIDNSRDNLFTIRL